MAKNGERNFLPRAYWLALKMKQFMRLQRVRSGGFCALTVMAIALVAGCDAKDVQVYKLAKDSSAPDSKRSDSMSMPPMAANEAAPQPKLKWTLPEGWQEVAPGEMRVASFAIQKDGKKADVSVVPLPGMAGGELPNVNRWRGQVGLDAVTEQDLPKLQQKVNVAGSDATLYDFAGETAAGEKSRILATVLHRDDTAWFFKMTGDTDLVAAQKNNFVAFLKSLKFSEGEQASLPAGHPSLDANTPAMPAGHPSMGAAMPDMPAADASAKPKWTAPSNWSEQPPTQMLLAKFSATDDGANAEITVSAFPGDVGGLTANVNRWRRQVGLSSLDDVTSVVKDVSVDSEKGSLVDFEGTDAKTGEKSRLIGVAVPHDGQTWFFKMLGDPKAVGAEKDAFLKFLQSVKF
jgi:hypothetical protein